MSSMGEFWAWVEGQLKAQDLSYYRIEQEQGLGNATISRPARLEQRPTLTICKALATALEYPLEEVLRRAGHLPPTVSDAGLAAQAIYLGHELQRIMAMLPPETQQQIMSAAITLAEAHAAARGIATHEEDTPKHAEPSS